MTLLSAVVHGLWLGAALPEAGRFFRDTARLRDTQLAILRTILRGNADTAFGRQHGFADIRSHDDYRKRVPLHTWDEVVPYVERLAGGEANVLTAAAVRLLEPTGGSAGGRKLIPYTAALQGEFHRGIAPWIVDLYRHYPGMVAGRSFWSISPQGFHPERSRGGIPVGFADDSEYLGWNGRLLGAAMAAPRSLTRVEEMDDFRLLLAERLVRCRDLALISIWSPTFLLPVLDIIERDAPALLRSLFEGRLIPPSGRPLPDAFRPRVDRRRAREVEAALARPEAERFAALWPRLAVLSCWTAGPSARYAAQLANRFPGVAMQGKGLLATEGMVTLPLVAAGGAVPAYRSHFLEFLADDGATLLADELATGATYRVVLTTGGGLYRYDIGDRVTVTGTHRGLPVLSFIGRERVSDRCGEKLAAAHVADAVEKALGAAGVAARFVLLAPEENGSGIRYALFVETRHAPLPDAHRVLVETLDGELNRNPHYAHCRRLGQLERPAVVTIAGGGLAAYQARCAREQRLGDIKPAVLDARTGWREWFERESMRA